MVFLEAVGALTVMAIGLYLLIRYLEGKSNNERKVNELTRYNDKSKAMLDKYIQDIDSGKPVVNHYELQQQLATVLANPEEERSVMEKFRKGNKEKEDDLERFRKYAREVKKLAYRYENDLFWIFDDNREMTKEDILSGIKLRFRLNDSQATELFELLLDKRIIDRCSWNDASYVMYEVGTVLTSELYSLDTDDMTYNKWLILQGKTLKPLSERGQNYEDKFGFNFNLD